MAKSEKSANKKATLIIIIASVLLMGSGVTFWFWTQTPTYSLLQIRKAIESHDVTKFEKYVDIKGVSSRLIDDMMSQSNSDDESSEGLEGLGTGLAMGFVQLIKPRLTDIIREQVVRLVESGDFGSSDSSKHEGDSEDYNLVSIADQIGIGKDGFKDVKDIKKNGKISIADFEFHNVKLDTNLILEFKLRDMGGYWQIVEIANFTSLSKDIKNIESARLSEINSSIRERISACLQVRSVTKQNRGDYFGFSKNIDIRLSVQNVCTQGVAGYSAIIRAIGSNGNLIRELNIQDSELIPASKTGGGTWSIDVNMFEASDNLLYDLSPEKVKFDVFFKRVLLEDGTELKPFDSYDEALQQQLILTQRSRATLDSTQR